MKKILFTPIGGTDPIRGSYDGAFIHISRVVKPDKVYMYLSKEMVEKEEADHRYTKTLELLSKHIEINKEQRHIRGGIATKEKYREIRNEKKQKKETKL